MQRSFRITRETRTTRVIMEHLRGWGLTPQPLASGTGAVCEIGSGRPMIALRADIDALPLGDEKAVPYRSTVEGMCHGCGHDAHTAMLVGAARALCARRDALAGTVVFMFQPGEEGWHGARHMIDDGLLDDPRPQAAFALHITPNLPRGVVSGRGGSAMASADTLTAVIEGRGGHAAMPHEALDPIPVACEIVTALQAYVARRVRAFDPVVLSITKIDAGMAAVIQLCQTSQHHHQLQTTPLHSSSRLESCRVQSNSC